MAGLQSSDVAPHRVRGQAPPPLADVLVQVDDAPANAARLDLAIAVARRHGARLIGLHAMDLSPAVPAGTRFGGSSAIIKALDQMYRAGLELAAVVERDFRARLAREEIASEWRLAQGWPPDVFALHARHADLTILGQEDPDVPATGGNLAVIEHVLFASGRPVLILPFAGTPTDLGRTVLVGWNASREAARAVHDALPFMAGAAVTVLAVDPEGQKDQPRSGSGADIAAHLARHGVRVTMEQGTAAGGDAADVLLNRAAELGAGLLVVGGYGRPRIMEIILGGVTRFLLRRATLPVLMSH